MSIFHKKTIFWFGLALIIPWVGLASVNSVQAQSPDDLVVKYWSEAEGEWKQWLPGLASFPVFSETNFLPGESVTRWVKVTNNSGETQRIATEAINKNDPNNLGGKLNLNIKEGATGIFNNTLKNFFNQGETYLSDLAAGAMTQYDFIVSFNSDTDDSFQGKNLGFDLIVGFQGTEGGLPLPPPGGGGGGVILPPGLTIPDESVTVTAISETSVTIAWLTSYFSTSQVIYDIIPEKFDLSAGPDNYGYTYLKKGDDSGLEKVTGHTVTITGLTSETTYYYRCVSHGSLAISQEYSFATLGTKGEEKETTPSEGKLPSEEEEGLSEETPSLFPEITLPAIPAEPETEEEFLTSLATAEEGAEGEKKGAEGEKEGAEEEIENGDSLFPLSKGGQGDVPLAGEPIRNFIAGALLPAAFILFKKWWFWPLLFLFIIFLILLIKKRKKE